MKVKGITIWEQYAEFIAIGVVAVVFIVYVVFQLSDDTNAVKVGGKTLGPGTVDAELQTKADALARRIQDDAASPVELKMPEPMSSRFEASIAASINPAGSMSMPRPVVVVDAGSSVEVSGQPYIVPTIHSTQQPVTMQFFDGLDDSTVQGYPELQDRFETGPYDTTWITAAAVFDAAKILEQYQNPGPSNELPLRDKWYNGRVDIIDVVVERDQRIGREGTAWKHLQRMLDVAAVAIAAECQGGAERALELAVDYTKIREQFGRPVGSFQAVKHMAAECFAEIEPSRSLLWFAAHAQNAHNRGASRAASMAKARLAEVYSRTANTAVQMHGGIGFTWEHDIHFWFKRAKANEALFGTPAFHRERVAALSGW